jgi:hypothetical protein
MLGQRRGAAAKVTNVALHAMGELAGVIVIACVDPSEGF